MTRLPALPPAGPADQAAVGAVPGAFLVAVALWLINRLFVGRVGFHPENLTGE